MRGWIALAALTAALVMGASSAGAPGGKAAGYCKKSGGKVQVRYPAVGTNDPSSQIRLADGVSFCKFVAKDRSRIHVDLETLYATRPTLAALAYLTKPAPGDIPSGVNPASVYCSKLGGSDLFGGINATGGGWISKTDTDDPVLQACVFPDLSIIDSFGLFYRSGGIIRGIDLSKVLRYRPPTPPVVFGK
jgi:putative hemolysin